MKRPHLSRFTLRGFKTIRELKDFEPGNVTILIGPNGAGKTNFISFFSLLSWALTPPGNLQMRVAELGGASALLHDGSRVTAQIEASLTIESIAGRNTYGFRLFHAARDTFIFADENYVFQPVGLDPREARTTYLGAGHLEPKLIEAAEKGNPTPKTILTMLRRMIVHQFHDTSPNSQIRGKWDVEDGRHLKSDARNLAPFLYRLQDNEPSYYQRIVDATRIVLPFFAAYEFDPEYGKLLLKWSERGSDQIFNASQAADGMLRVMALIALLLQPERDLPDVLLLDEPELGLHPYAIEVLAGLIQSASKHVQVIVATQSVSLIDRFEPENIVVVDRKGRESTFTRQSAPELSDWLANYSLSELWEKNVLGGRPK
jgi:predicted ATPase